MPNSLFILGAETEPEPRKRGRPKADVPCTALTTWVPVNYYDKLNKMADDRHMSVSGLVRQILALKLGKCR
jgi:hypothetical protein